MKTKTTEMVTLSTKCLVFFVYLNLFKNITFKWKIIKMYFGVYNINQSQMYDKNITKTGREVLYWNVLTLFIEMK